MNIKWYISDLHACGHVRGEIIAREVNNRRKHRIDLKTNFTYSDMLGDVGVFLFQRHHTPDILERMRFASSRGIATFYELDDDLFHIPPDFEKAFGFYSDPRIQFVLKQFVADADVVTCTSAILAEAVYALRRPKTVLILDNLIDYDMWQLAPRDKVEGEIRIVWMASASHKMDAPIVESALLRLMKERPQVKLLLIGWIADQEFPWIKDFPGRVICLPWVDIVDLPGVMAGADIGIAPLKTNAFNAAKSNLKVLQYGALGAVPVVSSIDAYRRAISNGHDGVIIDDDGDWFDALKELIDNDVRRKEMSAMIRTKIEGAYNVKNGVVIWESAFEAFGGKRS